MPKTQLTGARKAVQSIMQAEHFMHGPHHQQQQHHQHHSAAASLDRQGAQALRLHCDNAKEARVDAFLMSGVTEVCKRIICEEKKTPPCPNCGHSNTDSAGRVNDLLGGKVLALCLVLENFKLVCTMSG